MTSPLCHQGFHLSTDNPFFGASPDTLVTCQCCGQVCSTVQGSQPNTAQCDHRNTQTHYVQYISKYHASTYIIMENYTKHCVPESEIANHNRKITLHSKSMYSAQSSLFYMHYTCCIHYVGCMMMS